MQYIRVIWTHEDADMPIEILSEIDDERYEVRKIDRFADNRIQCASEDFEEGDTRLGEKPWPQPEEVNDAELCAAYITQEEFEARWREVTAHRTQGG